MTATRYLNQNCNADMICEKSQIIVIQVATNKRKILNCIENSNHGFSTYKLAKIETDANK